MAHPRSWGVAQPLTHSPFATLYAGYFLSFVAITMVESTVMWAVADSGASAAIVAMVSTAGLLPIVFLILPFGTLADILKPKTILLSSQIWATIVSLALAAAVLPSEPDLMILLGLTSAFAIATAARLPLLNAMVPVSVTPDQLPNAMTLFGMAMSMARLFGPAIAFVILTLFGKVPVFVAAAAISAFVYVLLRRAPVRPNQQSEPFTRALRTAVQFAASTPAFSRLLALSAGFFVLVTGPAALAPLHAKLGFGHEPFVFMSVVVTFGAGALFGGISRPWLAGRFDTPRILRISIVLTSIGGLAIAFAPLQAVLWAGSIIHGAGWIIGLSCLTTQAQTLLPEWVRARGMALMHMSTIGGVSIGAAVWGGVAEVSSTQIALIGSALVSLLALPLPLCALFRQRDLSKSETLKYWFEPTIELSVTEQNTPVEVSIDYDVKTDCIHEFLNLLAKSRRARLREGATDWSAWRSADDPCVFTEKIGFASLRHHKLSAERTTKGDYELRAQKVALLKTKEPQVRFKIAQQLRPLRDLDS